MAPRRRCTTCGSKQWHKEPFSGLIACSEGHVLQNYRNETNEVDQFAGPHALTKRVLKSARKGKGRAGQADPQLYHGARGRYHYFVCQQLILRMQIEAVVKLWNLPPEFETISRDVWSLHLSLLPDPPPPEPYLYLQEQEHGGNSSGGNVVDTPAVADEQVPETLLKGHDLGHESAKDSEDIEESGGSETEDDSDMEKLLRQNSEISSTSGEEDLGDPARTPNHMNVGRQSKADKIRILESPTSTLAILVIAFWILRIPIMYRDLARIIETHELPYLDPVRFLPSNMVAHLTKHSIQALSPHHVPSTLSVHKLAARLGKRLKSSYGLLTPECNAAPLLWRLTRSIGGTPTLYSLAKRLAYILALPLTLHPALGPGLRSIKTHDPDRRKHNHVPPEVALMATLIIVLKMAYGLDGRPRSPRDVGDPVLALPRPDEWLLLLKELGDVDANTRGELFGSGNALAVGDLDERMLDDYLGFCHRALTGSESDDTIMKNFFPIQKAAFNTSTAEVKPARPRLPAGTLPEGEESAGIQKLRPAEDYTIWNSKDVFGTLPEDYQLVLGRAAKWVGTREAYLSGVVEVYEKRFVRWWDVEKRRSKDSDEA